MTSLLETDTPTAATHDRAGLILEIKTFLRQIIVEGRAHLEAIARAQGLTYYQALVLLTIRRLGPEPAMSAIAESLRIPPSTVTSVVDALLERNLVTRGTLPEDRRTVTASLTSAGADLAAELASRNDEIFAARFADLSAEDLLALRASLETVATRPV